MPKLLSIPAALVVVALISACDLQEDADKSEGRMLFQQNCGTCHSLAEAGTSAEVGPNLDAAFAQARADGMDSDTIEGVVAEQVENPRPAPPEQVDVYMPAELVSGDDLEAVSSYVASVAGIPGIEPPKLPPEELFAQQCGICHTLAAAGSTSTTGPNLDQSLAGKDPAYIRDSILSPDMVLAPGFAAGIMPDTFATTLTQDDIDGLVKYIQQSVGGGGGGAAGGGGGGGAG